MFSMPWKIGTGIAAIMAVILGFLLFSSYNDNKALLTQKQELVSRIEDPKTGYVARLTQANANVVTLRAAIEDTNQKMRLREAEAENSRVKLSQLNKKLAEAQAETRAMEVRLKQFLATKPQGGTLDARVRDIDSRVLKELRR